LNSEIKQQELNWRRSKVIGLTAEGLNQKEIAQKLHVDTAAINRDMQFLRQQAFDTITEYTT
jgi:DNA-binding NarL/FixJ family response regulator